LRRFGKSFTVVMLAAVMVLAVSISVLATDTQSRGGAGNNEIGHGWCHNIGWNRPWLP